MSARMIDDVRCPRCRSATLVTETLAVERNGWAPTRYRYCSFVECDHGDDS